MSEGGYKIRNQADILFITFAVVEWVDVFTRKDWRDIVLGSIRFSQKEKRMQSGAIYVFSKKELENVTSHLL